MTPTPVVSHTEWISARKALLAREKEFTKQREELTRLRQQLPWRRVEANYNFDGITGQRSLSDLFGDQTQLLIYHFMFGPDWTEGCKSCSLIADHYNPLVVHLKARDVAFATVSRAPVATLDAYRRRMGWSFEWVSSLNCDFNRDFRVTFTQEEMDAEQMDYNYEVGKFPVLECPGISSFAKDEHGGVFHTYSAFARGLENLMGIYDFLDIVPKGRDEAELTYGMEWVRHHDRYDDESFVDPYVELMT